MNSFTLSETKQSVNDNQNGDGRWRDLSKRVTIVDNMTLKSLLEQMFSHLFQSAYSHPEDTLTIIKTLFSHLIPSERSLPGFS